MCGKRGLQLTRAQAPDVRSWKDSQGTNYMYQIKLSLCSECQIVKIFPRDSWNPLLPCGLERLADIVVVHRDPGDGTLGPRSERCRVFEFLGVRTFVNQKLHCLILVVPLAFVALYCSALQRSTYRLALGFGL